MITFTHLGGVGVNGRYSIERDGVCVAYIRRWGATDCLISSVHYGERLAQCKNVQRARERALEMKFPDAETVYEQICARIEAARRHWKEEQLRHKVMEAVYDLANGSNSAQSRLIELAAEIEAFATDRSQTREVRQAWALANKTYVYDEPCYPVPPAKVAA